jgi:hypothetical protein
MALQDESVALRGLSPVFMRLVAARLKPCPTQTRFVK